jgi:hypothetical protein
VNRIINTHADLQDLQQLTPELDYLKVQDKKIRARLVSMEPGRFVLVSGDSVEQMLQRAEQVYLRLDKVKQAGDLEDYFGLYPWLLSQQQQLKNQRVLLADLTDETREFWRNARLPWLDRLKLNDRYDFLDKKYHSQHKWRRLIKSRLNAKS